MQFQKWWEDKAHLIRSNDSKMFAYEAWNAARLDEAREILDKAKKIESVEGINLCEFIIFKHPELARLRRENEELKVENNCLKAKIVNRQYAYLDPKPSEDGRA